MQIINNLNIEKAAAQVVMPRLSADLFYKNSNYQEKILKFVEIGIGGFCVFEGDIEETAKMIAELQSLSEIPLLFSADFEYGLPMRLKAGTAFPHAMALGINDNIDDTKKVARSIAIEAKNIGINWILAPVCDINSNPKNPIINIRSFGENSESVIKHSTAIIEGIQNEGLLACAKHFPGHGDTDIDSHLTLPILSHNKERIDEIELKPFINAIKVGVKSIMIGHLAVPSIDDSLIPASLSYKVITELLKEKLGYQGLIISDALDMKAITNKYLSAEAAMLALNAGNDIILLPENPDEAIVAVTKEAEINEQFKTKLFESVNKILRIKDGLKKHRTYNKEIINTYVNHEKFALKVAFNAIRIEGELSILPIKENNSIAGFAFIQGDDISQGATFFNMMAQACQNDCDFGFMDENVTNEDVLLLTDNIKNADLLLLAFFYKARAYHGSINFSEKIQQIIIKLSEGKKTIAILFGNPYLKNDFEADLIISTYSDSLPSIAASVMKLTGREIDSTYFS